MLSFRTPAMRLSMSSGRVFSAPAGGGASLDAVESKPNGTRGTGGTFWVGLVEHFGVVPRLVLVLREVVDRLLAAVPGRDGGAVARDGDRPSSGLFVAAAELFLRFMRVAGELSSDGVGSLAASMVVRRVPLTAWRFGVDSALGVSGRGCLGFRTRSCIRLASRVTGSIGASGAAGAMGMPSAAAWRSRRMRDASALRSSGRQLIVCRSLGIKILDSSCVAVAQPTSGSGGNSGS